VNKVGEQSVFIFINNGFLLLQLFITFSKSKSHIYRMVAGVLIDSHIVVPDHLSAVAHF